MLDLTKSALYKTVLSSLIRNKKKIFHSSLLLFIFSKDNKISHPEIKTFSKTLLVKTTIPEENIGTHLYDLDLGNGVLDMKPKAQTT